MVTFAGRSAYEPASKTGAAGFYMLIIPAIVAAGYIAWLKKRPTAIGHATPDLKANDVIADTSTIDATYEKLDQELATDNLDRATWTRAQGDAEGNAERAKALYIKYRAQRLLAASRDESGHQATFDVLSLGKPAKKYNSRFVAAIAGILVCAVLAVIVIGFFTEKPAPTKGATSAGNVFDQFDTEKPAPTKGADGFKPLDFSAGSIPVSPGSSLDKFLKGGSDAELAARFGLTLQEYQRRDARSKALCITRSFHDFTCMAEVLAGER